MRVRHAGKTLSILSTNKAVREPQTVKNEEKKTSSLPPCNRYESSQRNTFMLAKEHNDSRDAEL